MKASILFILGSIFFGLTSKAHDADAFFFSKYGQPIVVFVNGQKVNQKPSDKVRIDHISSGKHFVTVKVWGKRGMRVIERPVHLRKGHKSSFEVTSFGRRNLNIQKVAEEPLHIRQRPTSINRKRNRIVYNGRYNKGNVYNMVNMNRVMRQLEYEKFDSYKLKMVQRELGNKKLYVADLKLILNQFTFESNRLDIALNAYDNVIDKRNFHQVYDAFKFRSSIRKLERRSS